MEKFAFDLLRQDDAEAQIRESGSRIELADELEPIPPHRIRKFPTYVRTVFAKAICEAQGRIDINTASLDAWTDKQLSIMAERYSDNYAKSEDAHKRKKAIYLRLLALGLSDEYADNPAGFAAIVAATFSIRRITL